MIAFHVRIEGAAAPEGTPGKVLRHPARDRQGKVATATRSPESPLTPPLNPAPIRVTALLSRSSLLFGLWLVLAGPDPLGLPFGLAAALLGARASLALLPPASGRANPGALARLLAGVLRQSVVAGGDIAIRAFARPPRLAPGILAVPFGTAPGAARDGLRLLASLAPGALPLETREDGTLLLHVLDTAMPHAADLAATEAALRAAMGDRHG